MNLKGAHLWDANLAGAELQGANLAGAELQGANLAGAGLWRANLQGVRLYSASDFQSLTEDQLIESCFWDKDIKIWNKQTEQYRPIDETIIEKATQESPYDVAVCTEY